MQERKTDVDPFPIIDRLHGALTGYERRPAPSEGELRSPWNAVSTHLARHQSGSWEPPCTEDDVRKMHGVALALIELLKYEADRRHRHVFAAALATRALADGVRAWRIALQPMIDEVDRHNPDRGLAAQPSTREDGSIRPPLFTISEVLQRIARTDGLSDELDSIADVMADQLFLPEKLEHKTGRPTVLELKAAARLLADAGFTHREVAELLVGKTDQAHIDQVRKLLRPSSTG